MKAIRSIRPGAWKAHRQDESSRHRQLAPERMDPQGGAGGVFSSGRGIYPRIVKGGGKPYHLYAAFALRVGQLAGQARKARRRSTGCAQAVSLGSTEPKFDTFPATWSLRTDTRASWTAFTSVEDSRPYHIRRRVASNQMLPNFVRTRSLNGSSYEIGDIWPASPGNPTAVPWRPDLRIRDTDDSALLIPSVVRPNGGYVKPIQTRGIPAADPRRARYALSPDLGRRPALRAAPGPPPGTRRT